MYLQKAAVHLSRKAAIFVTGVRVGQVRRLQKGMRCLTTECLSQRQKSDVSDMFDIIASVMCL